MPPSPCRSWPRHALLAVALLAAAAAAAAQEDTASPVRRDVELERRLLRADLADLREARADEAAAAERLDEILSRIGDGNGLAGATGLAADLRAASDAVAAAAARRARLLDGIAERLRRLGILAVLARSTAAPAVPDVLTGRWRVTIGPAPVTGLFELSQRGTVVSGTYRLDDGHRGSLEGTYVDGVVRLRRIDATAGFDSSFEARVQPAAGRLSGSWQPTILSDGGPGGGEWSAEKVPAEPPAAEEGQS